MRAPLPQLLSADNRWMARASPGLGTPHDQPVPWYDGAVFLEREDRPLATDDLHHVPRPIPERRNRQWKKRSSTQSLNNCPLGSSTREDSRLLTMRNNAEQTELPRASPPPRNRPAGSRSGAMAAANRTPAFLYEFG